MRPIGGEGNIGVVEDAQERRVWSGVVGGSGHRTVANKYDDGRSEGTHRPCGGDGDGAWEHGY